MSDRPPSAQPAPVFTGPKTRVTEEATLLLHDYGARDCADDIEAVRRRMLELLARGRVSSMDLLVLDELQSRAERARRLIRH